MHEKLQRLEKLLRSVNKQAVYIGVVGSEHTDKDTQQTISMPELAAVHEFGADIKVTPRMRAYLHTQGIHLKKDTTQINIPERSFLRSSIKENKEAYKIQLAQLLKKAVHGSDAVDAVYSSIGAIAAGQAQKKISNGQLTPLTPQTIKRKGSSRPLYDTGQLAQAITWVVRDE